MTKEDRSPKLNYTELKRKFFESEHVDLSPFLREEGVIPENTDVGQLGGNQRKKFMGWADEKKEWTEKAFEKAKKKIGSVNSERWEQVFKQMDTARTNGLIFLAGLLGSEAKLKKFEKNPKSLVTILRHLRLEAGESTENIDDPNGGNNIMIGLPANGFEVSERRGMDK